jgi:hypothetical protein
MSDWEIGTSAECRAAIVEVRASLSQRQGRRDSSLDEPAAVEPFPCGARRGRHFFLQADKCRLRRLSVLEIEFQMNTPPKPKRQRSRAPFSQADLLRAIRAAKAEGWSHVEIERPCGTVIRLRHGAEPTTPEPAGRGLTIVP